MTAVVDDFERQDTALRQPVPRPAQQQSPHPTESEMAGVV